MEVTPETNFDERLLTVKDDEIVRPIYTVPLHEGRLVKFCRGLGIPFYLPLHKVWKVVTQRHGGREYQYPKEVLRPMFPSYIFVKMNPEQRGLLFKSNSIAKILAVTNQPRLLEEIQMVRQVEGIALHEQVDFNCGIKEGEKFLIESGPWQGIYGWLIKKEKRYLWTVEIECLNGIIQASINPAEYKMTKVEE